MLRIITITLFFLSMTQCSSHKNHIAYSPLPYYFLATPHTAENEQIHVLFTQEDLTNTLGYARTMNPKTKPEIINWNDDAALVLSLPASQIITSLTITQIQAKNAVLEIHYTIETNPHPSFQIQPVSVVKINRKVLESIQDFAFVADSN